MRALVLHEPGGPDSFRLEDIPSPTAGPGEVLVNVKAVSINPIDYKTRQGSGFRNQLGPAPWVLGWDLAGTVAAVGPGVTRFRVGDAVFGLARFPVPGRTFAEFAAVPETDLAPRPEELDVLTAAALPLVGLTAWQALNLVGLKKGERLLVLGGAGGVGHVAIGMALARGAEVAATASAAKASFIAERGALPLDYAQPRWASETAPFDVVLNTVGSDAWADAHPAVRDGSRVIHIAAPAGKYPVDGVTEQSHLVHPDSDGLVQVSSLVVAGQVKPYIEQVYEMSRLGEAQARLESGRVKGKLVLAW